jgi:dienelactone hydrolase
MLNLVASPDRPSTRHPLPVNAGVARTPFYFASHGQSLFAWLHRREQARGADHGVIICPPVGHEQVHAHRSLRHLADALAAASFTVLRFDFHGTGDSAGCDEDPDRVATWLANIRDAQTWLKQQLGCTRISLIGLRLGAALATAAAGSAPVDGLLLWAPVVKGRAYVREMKAISLTTAGNSPSPAATKGGIEAAGFLLTEQTAHDLSCLDLLQCRPQCGRALIVARDDTPSDTRLLEHFTQLGIDAQQTAQPGYADMMAEPHYSEVPQQAINRIVDWLSTPSASGTGPAFEADARPDSRTGANGTPDFGLESLTGADGDPSQERVRERVMQISAQPHLFGIVSEPANAPRDDLPIIVMINAGSAYRVGPNRLYVSLARELAAKGFRSLRMDLSGLGDSVAPQGVRENAPYPTTAFRDIDLALAHVRSHFGAERVVLTGLCSGAYAAFQSAAQLSSPVLVESMLINPLTFFWEDGMSLEVSPALQLKSFQECMKSAWQPAKWLKFVSGRSKIGIAGALRMFVQRWRLRRDSGHPTAARAGAAPPDGFPSHPSHEDVPGDLERIAQAGRHLACFFARSDPGYGLLMLRAKKAVTGLVRAGSMSMAFVDDADHTFSRHAARRTLVQAIADHLGGRYLRSIA